MGDLMSSLSSLGTDVMQGFQGAGQAVGDLTGFSGGGGPLSPGTLNAVASNFGTAPDVLNFNPGAIASEAGGAASALTPASVGSGIASELGGWGQNAPTSNLYSDITTPIDATAIGPDISNAAVPGKVAGNFNPTGTLTPGGITAPAGVGNTWLQNIQGTGSNWLQSLMKNPKLLGEGGLLAAELINAGKKPPGEAALQALATQQSGFAKNQGELALGESAGMLPAGLTNMYQQQLDANLAAIRAQHAGNPGSSAQMQDEAKARADIQAQMAVAGQQLAQSGWQNVNQATGYESQLLQTILDAETQQSTQLGQALAAFAGAAAK